MKKRDMCASICVTIYDLKWKRVKVGEEVECQNVNNVYIVLINIKIYLQDGDNKL